MVNPEKVIWPKYLYHVCLFFILASHMNLMYYSDSTASFYILFASYALLIASLVNYFVYENRKKKTRVNSIIKSLIRNVKTSKNPLKISNSFIQLHLFKDDKVIERLKSDILNKIVIKKEAKGNFLIAATLYQLCDENERAIDSYLKSKSFSKAINLAEKSGGTLPAETYIKASKEMEKAKKYSEALDFAKKSGSTERVEQIESAIKKIKKNFMSRYEKETVSLLKKLMSEGLIHEIDDRKIKELMKTVTISNWELDSYMDSTPQRLSQQYYLDTKSKKLRFIIDLEDFAPDELLEIPDYLLDVEKGDYKTVFKSLFTEYAEVLKDVKCDLQYSVSEAKRPLYEVTVTLSYKDKKLKEKYDRYEYMFNITSICKLLNEILESKKMKERFVSYGTNLRYETVLLLDVDSYKKLKKLGFIY